MAAFMVVTTATTPARPPVSPDPVISPVAEGYIKRAEEMEKQGNYRGVIDQISMMKAFAGDLHGEAFMKADYMYAMAYYHTGDSGCVILLKEFAEKYPWSPLALKSRLTAADFLFFTGEYGPALTGYSEIDTSILTNAERNLYDYRKGYCMVRTGLLQEASELFGKLQIEPAYSTVSCYYLAYIDYARGNYPAAYKGFSEVESSLGANREDGIWPEYYMVQIDYERGEYARAATLGKKLLQKGDAKELRPETERITGLSLFKEGDTREAERYLRNYLSTPEFSVAPDALYALGVILYDQGNVADAEKCFLPLTDTDDAAGQGALLYLGQIALSRGDTDVATLFLERSARMDYDSKVTETALYNYIAARTRGGNIPFASSIDLYKEFLERFPNSPLAGEVDESLAAAYLQEKEYGKALECIRRIRYPSDEALRIKKTALYEWGKESMIAGRGAEARRAFAEALDIDLDNSLDPDISLWLGDACYSLGDYPAAVRAYEDFLDSDQKGYNRTLALYDLASAKMMTADYKGAVRYYESALNAVPSLKRNLRSDALVRLADANYYTGAYNAAIQGYSTAIKENSPNADYAIYRRAVVYGLTGNTDRKLKELEAMPKDFEGSPWLPAALLETAATYASMGKTTMAEKAVSQLNRLYGETSQARAAMLELAVAYNENGETGRAETTYREIITKWPTSNEAQIADSDLRKIYASGGKLEEYVAFLSGIEGAPRPGKTELEAASFDAASRAASTDTPEITLIEKYIADYPDGTYIAEALAMKGEFYEEKGVAYYPQALKAYKELETKGDAEYMGEAYAGIMRTTANEEEKLKYARLVKKSAGLSGETLEEASYIEAAAMLERKDEREQAIENLKEISQNTLTLPGAKAAVTLGQYYLDNKDYDSAYEVFREFTDRGTPHEYWLARGFIGLADATHAQGKDYLATEYLKSLRDNYPGEELDIQDMINSRLKKWKVE